MLDVVGETLDDLVLKGMPKANTLEDSLDAYTKPNLIKLAELNDFEVKKSWNKTQMIEVISEGIRGSLDDRLSTFDDEQLKELHKILEGNSKHDNMQSEVVVAAVRKGLLYASSNDDEILFTMPAEIEEKLVEVMDNAEPVEVEEKPAAEVVNQPRKTVPFVRRPQRRQPVQQRIVGEKVGRNEPCPCGSGKKYKKCCWSKDQRI